VKIRIHKTIILPVVFNGCETWSLALREEYRLKELHNLYSSPSIITMINSRRMKCGTNGEKRNAYRKLVGRSGGKRPLGTPRIR
jgi:hypothetical protein